MNNYYVKSGDDFVEFEDPIEALEYAEKLSAEYECKCEFLAKICVCDNGKVSRTTTGDEITKWMFNKTKSDADTELITSVLSRLTKEDRLRIMEMMSILYSNEDKKSKETAIFGIIDILDEMIGFAYKKVYMR